MGFEYDPAKSAVDKRNMASTSKEAQALWSDPWLLEVPVNAEGEPRFLSIGLIAGKHWTAVWTHRSDSVRIISVRRARKEEVGHYENN